MGIITGITVAVPESTSFVSAVAERLSAAPKACDVEASVGSNPTATASLTRQNAGKIHTDRPGVRRLASQRVLQ
jgi:hypothetical protein